MWGPYYEESLSYNRSINCSASAIIRCEVVTDIKILNLSYQLCEKVNEKIFLSIT